MVCLRPALILAGLLLAGAAAWAPPAPASFTVPDNYRPLRYVVGDSAQAEFPVTWPFESKEDLRVLASLDGGLSWETRQLDVEYAVSGAGTTDGGAIMFHVPRGAGEMVLIYRNDGIDRLTDFTTITPTALNLHLDRLTMQLQQVENIAERRCVQITVEDDYNDGEGVPVKDVVLPAMRNVDGHAVVANDESDAVVWSRKSLGDWDCLTCPGDGDDDGICNGGPNHGEPCLTDADCPEGNCDNGECDGGSNDGGSCDGDEDCPGGECKPGNCVGGPNHGEPCDGDHECPEGYCGGDGRGGFTNCDFLSTDAVGVLQCSEGCPSGCGGGGGRGLCVGGPNNGQSCLTDADCPDGLCDGGGGCLDCSIPGYCHGGTNHGGRCVTDVDCPGGGECRPDRPDPGVCDGGINDGDPCAEPSDCPGGECRPPECEGGDEDGNPCRGNEDCPDGECPCSGSSCDYDVCHGGDNEGQVCEDDEDCPGGRCGPLDECCLGARPDLPCITDADCPDGLCGQCPVCDDDSDNDGDQCVEDEDCPNGECDGCPEGAVCGECDGGANDGNPCTSADDCPDGECECTTPGECSQCVGGGNDGQVCQRDEECPDGICVDPDPDDRCQGGDNDGQPCVTDADCPGGICDDDPPACNAPAVRGPCSAVDSAIAVFDGTSGRFLKHKRLRIGAEGYLTGLTAFAWGSDNDLATGRYAGIAYSSSNVDSGKGALYVWPWKKPFSIIQQGHAEPLNTARLNLGVASSQNDSPVGLNAMRWYMVTYPIHAFAPGLSTENQLVARIYFAEPIICPDDFEGSIVKAANAFTGEAVYPIQKNGSTVGTATFAASSSTATLVTSGSSPISYAAGDYLDIDAPSTTDTTGANLSFTLECYRSNAED